MGILKLKPKINETHFKLVLCIFPWRNDQLRIFIYFMKFILLLKSYIDSSNEALDYCHIIWRCMVGVSQGAEFLFLCKCTHNLKFVLSP